MYVPISILQLIFYLFTGKADLQAKQELEAAKQEQQWQANWGGKVVKLENIFDDVEQAEIDDDPSADLDDDDLEMGGKSEEGEGDEDDTEVVLKPKSALGKHDQFKSSKSDAMPPMICQCV